MRCNGYKMHIRLRNGDVKLQLRQLHSTRVLEHPTVLGAKKDKSDQDSISTVSSFPSTVRFR